MKLFSTLYEQTLRWSKHPNAPKYLSAMSFAESSFFPIPPDVMLMPMSLATPQKAFYFAWLTTLFSVLGGVLGYAIGYWGMELLLPMIESMGYMDKIHRAEQFFADYGVWVILMAGFSPVPYKLFTITAGATSMALLPFILASIVGRGARFFLVAGIMRWGGAKMEEGIRKWVDWLGWAFVLLVTAYIVYKVYF